MWRPPTPPPEVRSLQLADQEAEFLPYLATLLPTPRALKKFANTYRLLRISIPDPDLDGFLQGDRDLEAPDASRSSERGVAGPYQAAALLLAGIVADPGHARGLLDDLSSGDPDQDIAEILKGKRSPLSVRLATFITDLRAQGVAIHAPTSTYQRWAGEVARYSFDTYDLFTTRDSTAMTDTQASP